MDEHFRIHPAARIAFGAGEAERPPARHGAALVAALLSREGAPLAQPTDPALFATLTSGSSSGSARVILRRQSSWRAGFRVNAGLFGIGPGRVVAVPGRLVHSLALHAAVEALCLGATCLLLAGLRPDRQRATMAAAGADVLCATPAQLHLLLEGGAPLPALRHVVTGGGPLAPDLAARLARDWPGAALHPFYGTAECSFVTLGDGSMPPGAVGRPYPGVALRVTGPDGTDLAEGETGRIAVRSPYLFHGYGDEADPAPRDPGGWLATGDLGFLRDGLLHLRGRETRMVTVADQNVFPEAIEAFLATLPGVAQAAVLARPDAARGNVLEAVLAGDPAAEAAILAALRAALGPLKAPRRLHWRQDWPQLPSGKTDLAALARDAGHP